MTLHILYGEPRSDVARTNIDLVAEAFGNKVAMHHVTTGEEGWAEWTKLMMRGDCAEPVFITDSSYPGAVELHNKIVWDNKLTVMALLSGGTREEFLAKLNGKETNLEKAGFFMKGQHSIIDVVNYILSYPHLAIYVDDEPRRPAYAMAAAAAREPSIDA